jgi:hypothetical protein
MEINRCTNSGNIAVVETESAGNGATPRHRVKCPATGQFTAWADTIPEAIEAWNTAHPKPPEELPPIPLVKKNG